VETTLGRLYQTIGRLQIECELKDEQIAALIAERDQLAAMLMERPAPITNGLVAKVEATKTE